MTDAARTNIFIGRPDTMLGICEAVGTDLGIPPNLLRLALGMTLLFQPVAVLATYAAMGVAVLVSRLLFPAPHKAAVAAPVLAAENDVETRELALAA